MRPSLKGAVALSPIIVFLGVFAVSSYVAGDFYKVPVSAAFLIACIYALAVSGGSMREKVDHLTSGASDSNILLMVWIFILAGVFAGTSKQIGAVDAAVSLTLHLLPSGLVFVGLFLTSCFISMAVGTSTGTIVALVPIAAGIAQQCGMSVEYMAAVIVGGAFFGDNLSFISDTTIAATRAVGCEMRDKFRVNIFITAPAVLLVCLIYIFQGSDVVISVPQMSGAWYLVLPYILIILLSLLGLNVVLVLVSGIILNAVIGFATGTLGWTDWLMSAGGGISGMGDLIIVTIMAGGLLELIRRGGGLDFAIGLLTRRIRGARGAQFSIAALVSIANLCTANNTIAIITSGRIAKHIGEKYGVDPRKTASVLDTFSCLIQSIIPYGAQLLMASALAGCSSVSIIPFLYYSFIMGACAVLAIIFHFPERKF